LVESVPPSTGRMTPLVSAEIRRLRQYGEGVEAERAKNDDEGKCKKRK
jgi:hypothetical protein